MVDRDIVDLEAKLLHELIVRSIEEAGYKVDKINNIFYKVTTKHGIELSLRLSVTTY